MWSSPQSVDKSTHVDVMDEQPLSCRHDAGLSHDGFFRPCDFSVQSVSIPKWNNPWFPHPLWAEDVHLPRNTARLSRTPLRHLLPFSIVESRIVRLWRDGSKRARPQNLPSLATTMHARFHRRLMARKSKNAEHFPLTNPSFPERPVPTPPKKKISQTLMIAPSRVERWVVGKVGTF